MRDSKWHHVVAKKTNNEVKLYVDTDNEVKLYVDTINEKVDTTIRSVDSGLSMRIGHCEVDDTNSLKGKMDDIRIYNRALAN